MHEYWLITRSRLRVDTETGSQMFTIQLLNRVALYTVTHGCNIIITLLIRVMLIYCLENKWMEWLHDWNWKSLEIKAPWWMMLYSCHVITIFIIIKKSFFDFSLLSALHFTSWYDTTFNFSLGRSQKIRLNNIEFSTLMY